MSKQWDNEYISQAIVEEIALARLDLDKRATKPAGVYRDSNVYLATGPGGGGISGLRSSEVLPKWRREPRAAGALAIKHALNIRHDEDEYSVSVGYGAGRRSVTEFYGAHPDRDAATMAAICRAAIQMLTERRDELAALNPTRSKSSRQPRARAKTKE
jgi:hypothetical protein